LDLSIFHQYNDIYYVSFVMTNGPFWETNSGRYNYGLEPIWPKRLSWDRCSSFFYVLHFYATFWCETILNWHETKPFLLIFSLWFIFAYQLCCKVWTHYQIQFRELYSSQLRMFCSCSSHLRIHGISCLRIGEIVCWTIVVVYIFSIYWIPFISNNFINQNVFCPLVRIIATASRSVLLCNVSKCWKWNWHAGLLGGAKAI